MEVGLTDDIALVQSIRRVVFIEGQNVPEAEEVDGRDGEALHLLLLYHDAPVGTARLLIDGESGKIGRVAVLEDHRGKGLGVALINASLDVLRDHGLRRAKLGAQTHAIGFYEKLGFTASGPEFLDAGIPHRAMVCDL
ncbi:MAG: GNAT family N-acetyltransferase [Silicimonas sp.]|nr:GNAT family N-acetyltransferase [Silicimonas sp.]